MFNNKQKSVFEKAGLHLQALSEETVFRLAQRELDEGSLTDEQLIEFITFANALYRGGEPIISDADYDFLYLAELSSRQPDHPFLQEVEPEAGFVGKTVPLPERMLSTDKAYTQEAVEKWINRLCKSAVTIALDEVNIDIRITPKLDGFAAYDDGQKLYTRGDGRKGTDISRVFVRGLRVGGDGVRGQGAGEIVIDQIYFDKYLSQQFDNSRNFQAAVLAEKKEDPLVQKAIDDGAAVFMPFAQLPVKQLLIQDLLDDFDGIIGEMWHTTAYDVDGVVLEVESPALKVEMGATRHHHRWQIAYKENAEKATVTVVEVKPQTSRSGRVNPVAILEPTRLSGAVISRASAHHYGMVKEKGIGPGAIIELVRSGLVIPKIEKVVQPVEAHIPDTCPSCDAELVWDNDYLFCTNTQRCPAQLEHSLEHFFKTLGNVDGLGGKTIQKLCADGVTTISDVYALQEVDLLGMGFGEKTAANLLNQLRRSRSEQIEDWRFLAAFGVIRLAGGNCERLLQQVPLESVFELNVEQIAEIEGFAEITSNAIVKGLAAIRAEFEQVFALGFSLSITPLVTGSESVDSPVAGQLIVFTGAMQQGRDEMKRQAKALGAKIGNSVTGKTDLLVTGKNVGAAKISAAKEKGVRVLSEQEYFEYINQ
ncbi:MAG: BRCT domain-containing protein [Gammaproteobacteria bacterium]